MYIMYVLVTTIVFIAASFTNYACSILPQSKNAVSTLRPAHDKRKLLILL